MFAAPATKRLNISSESKAVIPEKEEDKREQHNEDCYEDGCPLRLKFHTAYELAKSFNKSIGVWTEPVHASHSQNLNVYSFQSSL